MNKPLIALVCLWLSLESRGLAEAQFPTSQAIERKIAFWQKIFTRYGSQQLVLHDKQDPRLILGVIAIPDFGSTPAYREERDDRIDLITERYADALADFAGRGPSAQALSPLHRRLWNLYAKIPDARQRLLLGEIELRTQGGLADTFVQAYSTSELYLPRMEKIFKSHGLPPELTRIVFVESMWNLKARSKVGASGIWQLMPAAARPYIKVTRQRDDRNSPLLATQAAVRILKSNYALLGTWPLAITAYNHGLGGMRRAVEQTGSRDLDDVIERYESPSFGFASQNFYAEFVAALRTHKAMKLGRIKDKDRPKSRIKVAVEAESSKAR